MLAQLIFSFHLLLDTQESETHVQVPHLELVGSSLGATGDKAGGFANHLRDAKDVIKGDGLSLLGPSKFFGQTLVF